MDPVSVGLLVALAGGAGGEVGRQAWTGLSALVRRPFRRGEDTAAAARVGSGEAELVALAQAPADPARAQALSTALAVRAVLDTEFHAGLRQWHEQAKLVRTGDGHVHNSVGGGTFYAPVAQGRDFSVHLPPEITPALSGLPAASPTFTGRDEHLGQLLEGLAPDGEQQRAVLVTAVAGLAGVGKTELAVRTATLALKEPGWFRTQADSDQRDTARTRLHDHYCNAARAAETHLKTLPGTASPRFPDRAAGPGDYAQRALAVARPSKSVFRPPT
jgi:hypothetical protein